MKIALFLDRDGVINELVERDGRLRAPCRIDDFKLKSEIVDVVKFYREAYRDANFIVIVVTNQPDISTGQLTWATLDAMHAKMRETIQVDDIMVCPHVDADDCDCRKPKPGMLLHAAKKHNIDLDKSFMIGDQDVDMRAADAAGVLGILCE